MVKCAIAEPSVGILGGTFDPIHDGHLALARRVMQVLRLDSVWLIPNAVPPHRPQPVATARQRAEMLRLAIGDDQRLRVDPRELLRQGRSFTVDTLREVRGELGAQARLVLILGADAFADLGSWSRWLEVFSLAQIAVVGRGSADIELPDGAPTDIYWNTSLEPVEGPARVVNALPLKVSALAATDLRNALRAGGSDCPIGLDPDVFAYIRRQGLYGCSVAQK